MRPKLAQGPVHSPRRALILGPVEVAGLIAEQLEEQGIESTVLEERSEEPRLPAFGDPDALNKLRAVLLNYRSRALTGGASAPYLHPGVSPWAERPEIVTLGQELGFNVIAPPARVLALFANKLSLLTQGERLNIPHLLISSDPLRSSREIEALMERQGQAFPIVLKAVKGGAAPGHLVIHEAEQLESRLPLWLEQLRMARGDAIMIAEKYLEGARLAVVPFVGFANGEIQVFPALDASLQCRHRKLVEFCPAVAIEPAMLEKLGAWTQDLANSLGYVGAGTFEFLVDSSRAFLVGGCPRLNATFPLWEKAAGMQAVAWQLAATEGRNPEDLPALAPGRNPHGIAVRIYAEDPILQLPQPGFVQEVGERREWKFPTAEARLALSVAPGARVSHRSSGLLGFAWIRAQDPRQALTVARGVLEELWVAGSLQTNIRFISELLAHPWVKEGIFHAGFVDEEFLPAVRPPSELVPVFAAICAGIPEDASLGEGRSDFTVRWAVGDQWAKPEGGAFRWLRQTEWQTPLRGVSGVVELVSGQSLRVCAFPIVAGKWQVSVGAWTLPVRRVTVPADAKRRQKPMPKILALVSGRVHAILFREGATVPAHENLLMIESLGSLIPHALPVDVKIGKWKVAAESLVHAGEELAQFETVNP